jgi:hypothetical protein
LTVASATASAATKLNSSGGSFANSGSTPAVAANRHAYPAALNYPALYEAPKANSSTPHSYFNMGATLPMGYSTPGLALHQYLIAAHLQSGLTNPLRNVPLPGHHQQHNTSTSSPSPLSYKSSNDDQTDYERKRKRSDSGIEDKFQDVHKIGRYDLSTPLRQSVS